MAAPRVSGPGPPRSLAPPYNTDAGERGEGHAEETKRASGGRGREEGTRRVSERPTEEGVAADRRERKYERSRVKRTNKQLASRRSWVRRLGRERKRDQRWTDGSRDGE